MIDFLKSTLNLSNFFSLWAIFCLISYWFQKRKLFKWLVAIGLLLFLVSSTSYIPKKLVGNLESQYTVLEPNSLDSTKNYYIHVLGAGYTLDSRLPTTAQLDTKTLGRLGEGMRVFRQLPHATLVTSGYSSLGLESQASVARRAAMELGIPPDKIHMLETPSTTFEEVMAFKEKFGDNTNVIIATDATHMPRAMKMYKAAGYKPIAAPTNFKVKYGPNNYNGFTMPKAGSIQIMNSWMREELAELKWVFEGRSWTFNVLKSCHY